MDIIDNFEVIEYRDGDIIKYDTVIDYEHYDNTQKYSYYKKGEQYEGYSHNPMIVYYKNGICHRENDLPAVSIINDRFKQYYIYVKNGKIARDNALPAFITTDESYNFNNLTIEQAETYISNNTLKETHLYYFKDGECVKYLYS